ncbi:Thiol:disulfide interchange protein DsbE [Nocardioides dokdonensis FR1436]|uniref:Thiol:disulfide interchange protein DsbE n=1 Tax=Nocardioides dokdonensis FR1436 TaxID=1300347 RepID=A0A1A9GNK8_9ACTN|nr:DsbE family thiol:disulfide interchange protein [Nocardioides dokdonensis]ANH39250.1 Thiol:disulfide interchange protein DsbE [Nocardioides dokdonensis FR1436]
MRRWLVLAAAVLGIAAVVSVLSDGFGRDPSVVPSNFVAQPAPDLAGPTLDGGTYDLDEHRTEVVLVNVWASWCAPCRAEHPVLAAAAEGLGSRGLTVVGINTQDTPEKARAFLREMGGEAYPSVLDRDGRHAVDWGTFGVPETFVIDETGTVRARQVGEVTPAWIEQHVVPLLDEH